MRSLAAALTFASSVQGYPEQGSEALGRGGAWVARATDPIALARNPAGLAGQPPRVSFGFDVPIAHTCFTRRKDAGDTTDDGVAPGASYPRTCDGATPFPYGYMAIGWRVTPKLGLGLGVVTPTGVPGLDWPQDGPQRYAIVQSLRLFVIPTLGAGYEIAPGFRLGASFGWGVTLVRTSAVGAGLLQAGAKPKDDDVLVDVTAQDLFVPRGTFGAHWTPSPFVEVGASFMASAPIDATGDALTTAPSLSPVAAHGNTAFRDCGQVGGSACGAGGNAHLTVAIPMEASLGVRVRVPRRDASHARAGVPAGVPPDPKLARDPLEAERLDVELDATWAGNSAIDRVGLGFTPGIPVPGTAGTLPVDASSPRAFRDVVGLHLGGDVTVVPSKLAVRAGAFVEPRAGVGPTGLEASGGARVGLSAGGTVRMVGPGKTAFDISAGYMHMLVADYAQAGLPAIAGVAPFRTRWSAASGTIASSLDVIHFGIAYRP